jgi:hypothetical protein
MCKLRIFTINVPPKDYTCDEVRELFPHWKEHFKKVNRCDEKDRHYINYCEEINSFLGQCKCTH